MRYILRFYVFIACFSGIAYAQVSVILPEWIKHIDLTSTSVNKNLIKEGYYYLLIDEQYNCLKKQNYFHYAMMAVTEESLTEVSQIEVKYDPSYQKAMIHRVIVHRSGVEYDRTKSISVKELNEESKRGSGILNGKKTLFVNLSDIRKGDIVEMSYSVSGENPIMKDFYDFNFSLSYGVPVGKIYLRLIIPKKDSISTVYKNTNIKPKVNISNVKELIWDIQDPEVINFESTTPDWYSPYGNVQISNMSTWSQVKKHYSDLFIVPNYSKKELRSVIDSIRNSAENIEDQITRIIEFVQTHVRYSGNESGIYSFIPRAPDYVLKNRFGDCKEKSVLLNEMLGYIGVESYPVLLSTYQGKHIRDDVPSIRSFDHCISAFRYNNQWVFIDPTLSYQRGKFKYREIPNYELGMILDKSREDFVVIPTPSYLGCSILEEFEILKSGDVKLKVKSEYIGQDADEQRAYFLVNSIYDVQRTYKEFYSKFTKNIEVLDTVNFQDNQLINKFVTLESYLLKEFWIPDSTSSKVIKRDFVPYALNSRLNYGDESERRYPLKHGYPLVHTQTITVENEGGWNVEMSEKKESNVFFDYSHTEYTLGDKLVLEYAYTSKTSCVLPSDYKVYKNKMDFINYNIVFAAQERSLADGTIGFNWTLILSVLAGLVLAGIFCMNIYKLNYTSGYVEEYNGLGGWLILVGIGVTLSPIVMMFAIFNEVSSEMQVDYSHFYFDEDSPYFSPMKGYFNLFVWFFNSVFFVVGILVMILFYRRKSSFRPVYCLYKSGNALFLILNVIILFALYGDSTQIEDKVALNTQTTLMIRVCVQAFIWVPYIWYSQRSRGTFTKGDSCEMTDTGHTTESNSDRLDPIQHSTNDSMNN